LVEQTILNIIINITNYLLKKKKKKVLKKSYLIDNTDEIEDKIIYHKIIILNYQKTIVMHNLSIISNYIRIFLKLLCSIFYCYRFYINKLRNEETVIKIIIITTTTIIIQSSHDNLNLNNSKNLTVRIVFYSPRKFFHYKLVRYLE
jgi:hypothetical protein